MKRLLCLLFLIENKQVNNMKIITLLAMGAIFIPLSLYSKKRFERKKTPGFFHNFWEHILDSFQANYGLWYIGAAIGTFAILFLNWDGPIQKYLQINNLFSFTFNRAMLMFGNFWHILLALILFWIAVRKRDHSLKLGASAGFQAVFSTVIVVNVLKIITGRRPPLRGGGELVFKKELFTRTDNPWDFQFDFWNHTFQDGRFMWPSGHTASIMAFVSALVAYYPEKHWIKWIGYPLALLMGIIMIDGDFHWTSDVWAGALIGHVLGYSVGLGFKKYSTH